MDEIKMLESGAWMTTLDVAETLLHELVNRAQTVNFWCVNTASGIGHALNARNAFWAVENACRELGFAVSKTYCDGGKPQLEQYASITVSRGHVTISVALDTVTSNGIHYASDKYHKDYDELHGNP